MEISGKCHWMDTFHCSDSAPCCEYRMTPDSLMKCGYADFPLDCPEFLIPYEETKELRDKYKR